MLENEQQNQEDPKTNLLNLDSGIEFIKPIRHKSSYYEQDFYVEPWDENQDNFLQLSPKQKEEQPQDRKTRSIKIKLPQSRTQSRQRSNETHQTVQLTLPYHDRAGSCHTLFQDQGFINDKAAYKNIVDRVRSIQINKNQIIQNNKNNNKQISLKFSANKKKIKQIVQVKQKEPFSWSDYYKFIQKNHNQIKPNKQQNPQITGYTIQINKSLQQKVDKDSIVRNFRLKSNYTKTIA
ncbi:unnamed protein product (macronuclear) [Paramecium tetraurelia]|uniref:Uncharacterized protein n=1 Tax=Paramecium tetraurelia TaxID=5888 RepID=A0EHH0_PARTE|nr:uncharacterized protein GSPATT00027085001 [Paramecium tetraurelia]CAK94761.1 unnamed protein product [Paramecium tetraurelia]|eukprot:XP_001462134.1 hypothetical protein (macronuclear) [Paramecium tetraurelia strain d4-2]